MQWASFHRRPQSRFQTPSEGGPPARCQKTPVTNPVVTSAAISVASLSALLAFLMKIRDFTKHQFALNYEKINKLSERHMSRTLRAMAVFLLVASCGGGYNSAPRDLDNACSIARERPEYIKAFLQTERKWGVPVHVQMATMHQESRFIGNARTPHKYALGVIPMGRVSSAYGYSQALDGTWDDYQRATGRRFARRDRIRDASDFMGWYMVTSRSKNGIPLHDARRQYLAYHEGHTGYSRQSYTRKAWLMDIANKVDARANMYQAQLATCGLQG